MDGTAIDASGALVSHLRLGRSLFTASLLLLAVACGEGKPELRVESPSSAAQPEAQPDSQPEGVLMRTQMALSGEGVMLVNGETGSTRALDFGENADRVLTALTAVLGEPSARGVNGECGAGPMEIVSFTAGLSVNVQRDQFVGWSLRKVVHTSGTRPLPLTTMSGIGLGSTRADLESAYSARIARSTLGMEFIAGGLQGLLETEGKTAPITDLWAGANCVAR